MSGVAPALLRLLYAADEAAYRTGWGQPPHLAIVLAAAGGWDVRPVVMADPAVWAQPGTALRVVRQVLAKNPPPHPVVGVLFVAESWAVAIPEAPAERAELDRAIGRRQLHQRPDRLTIRICYLVTRPVTLTMLSRIEGEDGGPQQTDGHSSDGDIAAALLELLAALPTGN